MNERDSRTVLLVGEKGIDELKKSRVAIFGLGGVGSYVVEGLARAGIGSFDLIDKDVVSLSNINRQLFATTSTVGRKKADVAKERVLDINPEAVIQTYDCFFLPETSEMFDFLNYDYIIDAVDTITAKLELVMKAKDAGIPIISSMGTGNKLDPSAFRICDIYQTRVCPLARVMRRECKKREIPSLKVLFSEEEPIKTGILDEETGKAVPGSISFVPSVAGLMIAGEVVRDICELS